RTRHHRPVLSRRDGGELFAHASRIIPSRNSRIGNAPQSYKISDSCRHAPSLEYSVRYDYATRRDSWAAAVWPTAVRSTSTVCPTHVRIATSVRPTHVRAARWLRRSGSSCQATEPGAGVAERVRADTGTRRLPRHRPGGSGVPRQRHPWSLDSPGGSEPHRTA